jgi:dihydroneopterin aldolase
LLDAVIVGAGPAGCSAAAWLAQLGLQAVLLERGTAACESLARLDIAQDWVLGAPRTPLHTLGDGYAAHLHGLPGVDLRLNTTVGGLRLRDEGGWEVTTPGGLLNTRCLVLATGIRPRRPAAYFAQDNNRVLDAVGLTAVRDQLPSRSRVLLLGGGDNAVENALYLHERGHAVTLCTRSGWRAQPGLVQRLQATQGLTLREGVPVPRLLGADAGGVHVRSETAGDERFDRLAVLFGYEAEPAAFRLVREALRAAELPAPPLDDSAAALPEVPEAGLFVAGDASGRWHPCVQTALADGVAVAKRVQQQVRHVPALARLRKLLGTAPGAGRSQVLRLTGLRFGARLGWLEREKRGTQPIQVDAELNMGRQPLMPDDDDLAHVLDYRKVRQIIIDECNAEHTHLIETLLGKLCLRLSRLPGVLGVRVQVTKLEIFDDCHVAMSAEHGAW